MVVTSRRLRDLIEQLIVNLRGMIFDLETEIGELEELWEDLKTKEEQDGREKAGPYIQTARAKKTPGKTVRPGGTVVIKAPGKKPMAFKKGGLHSALNVPQGENIPAGKKAAALAGRYGPKVKKMAVFAFKGALAKGRKTAGK